MSHWYLPDGSPFHYIEDAKGNLRAATLRDVRKQAKQGVYPVPSVTAIEGIIAAPGLTRWKIDQAIALAQGTTLSAGEIHAEMKRRLSERAQLGTDVHNQLEAYFKGDDVMPMYAQLGASIQSGLFDLVGEVEWEAEKTFYDSRGFGGCTDLLCPRAVIDFKTTEKELGKGLAYDSHGRQLAAYREGHGLYEARLFNVFIKLETSGDNTGLPTGEFLIVEHQDGDSRFDEFLKALALWKALKKYEGA